MDLVAIGTGLATVVVIFASQIPKIMASLKRDQLDSKTSSTQTNMVENIYTIYEKQIRTLTDRLTTMEKRVNDMDETIHVQAMKVTRLIVVVIQLKSLLVDASIPIPDHLRDEIDRLTAGPITHTSDESNT